MTSRGLHTVVTMEPYIVVNGIAVSPFGKSHAIPHMFYNIHRFLYWTGLSSTFQWIYEILEYVTLNLEKTFHTQLFINSLNLNH